MQQTSASRFTERDRDLALLVKPSDVEDWRWVDAVSELALANGSSLFDAARLMRDVRKAYTG